MRPRSLAIAVGITEAGEIKTLYAGQEFSAAQAEILKAGENGEILEGQAFKNPIPVFRRDFGYVKDKAKAKTKNKQA